MPESSTPPPWRAEDLAASQQWRIEVEPAVASEWAAAARRAASDGFPVEQVDRRRFPVQGSRALLERVHDLADRRFGFALLSGLPFAALDHPEQIALTCGISDHVGRVVVQNYEGQRVVDVRDDGVPYSHQSRGYRSNRPLPFHTDGAHLFTLACLGEAAEGGETIVVSASSVYQALAAESPQALAVLERGFYHHRRGQHDPGEPPLSTQRIPVFWFHEGLLHCCYNRNPIEWAEKEGVRLSAAERDALDAMDEVLAREDLQLRLRMRCGDCLVVNNFATLHSRTEYRDSAQQRRHLLRVWMTDPRSRRSGVSLLDLYVPEALRAS